MLTAAPPLVAALVTLVTGALLAALAPRLGWSDGPGALGGRKRQGTPVPTVGGAALLLGLAAGWALFDAAGRVPEALTPGRGLGRLLTPWLGATATLFPLGACCVAFLVGLADDLLPGGLRPRTKVLGQALAGCVLGAPLLASTVVPTSAALAVLVAFALGAIAAANLLNTFDNADGAAGALGLLGLAATSPLLAAPVAGFLPLNLLCRARADQPAARVPLTYLGDAGSHLLGVLILITPAAWPVLLIPALDLGRLSVLRVRSGSRPWVGDRRHLAHRLEQRKLSRLAVPALLAALAAPALLATWMLAWPWALLGGALTTGLFAAAVAWTSDPGPEPVAPASGRAGAGGGASPAGLLSGEQ